MKQSTQAIQFFEHLAMNAHHRVIMNELHTSQSPVLKDICSSNDSEKVKNHFSDASYLADSIKVTEI